MKLGDWIAVFDEGAQLVQYDSPERILANPANEFVENFIGSGAGLKQLTLTRVNEVELMDAITAQPGELASDVLSRLQGAGASHAVILDSRRRPVRRLTRRQLSRLQLLDDTIDDSMPVVSDQSTLNDALDTMLVSSSETAVVTGRRDVFRGLINVKTIMEAISLANASAEAAAGDAPVGLNSGAIPAIAVEHAVAAEAMASGNGVDGPRSPEEPR